MTGTDLIPAALFPRKAVVYVGQSTQSQAMTFLPKYSPDLNPIEQAFAKIKHWIR